MSKKRFIWKCDDETCHIFDTVTKARYFYEGIMNLLNEQQELIEELQVSDEMGWKRAEKFEKELKQKKIYIKRLEYKVQKFKEENEQLRKELNEIKENPINYF